MGQRRRRFRLSSAIDPFSRDPKGAVSYREQKQISQLRLIVGHKFVWIVRLASVIRPGVDFGIKTREPVAVNNVPDRGARPILVTECLWYSERKIRRRNLLRRLKGSVNGRL
jgi:hypothetical protein